MLKIFDPIFQKNYYFIYTRTYLEYKRILKNKFNVDTELDEECFGETEWVKEENIRGIVIWVRYTGDEYNDNNSIGHEIRHAVTNMLEFCGLEQCEQTDEVFAYVSGYITAEIMRQVKQEREFFRIQDISKVIN